jgi:uncharacterized protein YihD (DUF1040 family)
MKHSKKKIRKNNIRRRTKKTNYRKIQRGGMLTPGDKSTISDFMQSLSPDENIQIRFPFNNIQMDISLPDKPLNQFIDEWANRSCFDQAKRELTDNIMVLNRTMPKPESKIERENRILTNLNTQTETPFNFSVIPNMVIFITNPYDISVIKSKGIYSELVENNNFVGGILQPKQEVAAAQQEEITVPKEAYVLVKLMQQLTREYKIQTIYINGSKQSKFKVDETETDLPPDAYLYTTVCTGYASLLDNIQRMYKGTALDWSKVNTQILTSFFEDNSFQAYYTKFVKTFLIDTYNGPVDRYTGEPTGGQFFYSNAYRDGNVLSRIPNVSIDRYIRTYKDKYIDSSFFKLDPITENPGDGNFLQYVENITTYLIKVNTNIIIECVKIYYIFLKDIIATARTPGEEDYDGLIIAAIVEKKITDINAGVIHYSSQFRWLITKNTLENIKTNHFNIPDPILRNLEDVRMSGDNRFIRFFKGSTSRGPPAATAAAGFPDQEEGTLIGNNQQLNLQEDYIDAQGEKKPRTPTGEWQNPSNEYEPEEGDVDVIGGKKNKTRRKLNKRKRSNKRKAKF